MQLQTGSSILGLLKTSGEVGRRVVCQLLILMDGLNARSTLSFSLPLATPTPYATLRSEAASALKIHEKMDLIDLRRGHY